MDLCHFVVIKFCMCVLASYWRSCVSLDSHPSWEHYKRNKPNQRPCSFGSPRESREGRELLTTIVTQWSGPKTLPVVMLELSFSRQLLSATVFWVVTLCNSEKTRRFWVIYRLYLQGGILSQARKERKQTARWNSEDGGNILLRNVGLSPNYTTLQPKRSHSSYSPQWEPQIYFFLAGLGRSVVVETSRDKALRAVSICVLRTDLKSVTPCSVI
jgi:hypothetical protein